MVPNIAKVNILYVELNCISRKTRPFTFGRPGPECTNEMRIQYSDQIKLIPKEQAAEIDLVLIDGRFRAASCLKCLNVITDKCFIAFDDFLTREQAYDIVLKYYNIIEKTTDNRMVILQKKTTRPADDILEQDIANFELNEF